MVPRLPRVRVALCNIAGIHAPRGVAGFVLAAVAPGERGVVLWCWSSLIRLGLCVLYAMGIWQVWGELSR